MGQKDATARQADVVANVANGTIQVQNANDPTKKVQVVQQTWYAPAIDHWVKRAAVSRSDGRVREKNTTELVEYGRR